MRRAASFMRSMVSSSAVMSSRTSERSNGVMKLRWTACTTSWVIPSAASSRRNSSLQWLSKSPPARMPRNWIAPSAVVVEGAIQFRGILAGGDFDSHCKELFRLEDAADGITHDVVHAVHRSFITPFDRSEVLELITALDDTIDLMKDAARRMDLYKV